MVLFLHPRTNSPEIQKVDDFTALARNMIAQVMRRKTIARHGKKGCRDIVKDTRAELESFRNTDKVPKRIIDVALGTSYQQCKICGRCKSMSRKAKAGER